MVHDILIKNSKGLVQVRNPSPEILRGKELNELPVLPDAYLLINAGKIHSFGPMAELPPTQAKKIIDASGRLVFPSFVDSHTHLVFAATREEEFVMKLKGATYEQIAAGGGGILNSAKKLQALSENELFERSVPRAWEIIRTGTGAVEIKSGYGLTIKDEIKMLRVARRIGLETPLTVKTTFLGAHAVPQGVKKDTYVRLVIEEMIPAVAEEKLADYVDVFCETGFFTMEETEQIIEQGKKYGLQPRIHANQLSRSGGVQVGVRGGAISVDHLENIGEEEINLLKGSATMPVALPGAAFFLNMPFTPARQMIDEGLAMAIATDFNPGSSPCGSMPLMISLACIKMRMTPEEAINAATINSAYTLGLTSTLSTLTPGKTANLFITKPMNSIAHIPYHFGSNPVSDVILNGEVINVQHY